MLMTPIRALAVILSGMRVRRSMQRFRPVGFMSSGWADDSLLGLNFGQVSIERHSIKSAMPRLT